MNKIITSKAALLEASQKLASKEGLHSINIRTVAKSCGVSVGSVYNYFPSKADLIAETVGTIWESIFHMTKKCDRPQGFTECIVWLFDSIRKGSKEYPDFFTLHSMNFAAVDKEKGRDIMNKYFDHIKDGLLQALSDDTHVRGNAFDKTLSQSAFIDFIFANIIVLLVKKSESCDILIEIIKRTIY